MTGTIRRIRAVVVAFNNADFIGRCLGALTASAWSGELEVVVVDNASHDGSADVVAAEFPDVRLIRSPTNIGFAGGANVGMGDLDGADAVALVNSDAFVTPGWLDPLAAALDADPGVGAASPKILLDGRFVEVAIRAPLQRPDNGDRRALGVRVVDPDGRSQYPEGFSVSEAAGRWSIAEQARVWVPADARPGVTLAADRPKVVWVQGVAVTVGPEPVWCSVVAGEPFDVINNAGNELTSDWYGRDRGWLEPDRGQYDTPGEIWGWCGGAVLLRTSYLQEVGRFDERLFLYYEDIDLAWRGRKAGWRYRYEPASVVRHEHSKSSGGEASPFVDHLNQRNRLVVLSRHAGPAVAAGVWARYGAELTRNAWGEIGRPLLERTHPHPNTTRRRVRAGAAAVRLLTRR